MNILEALIISEIALTEQMTAEVNKGEKEYNGHKFAKLQSAFEIVQQFRKEINSSTKS